MSFKFLLLVSRQGRIRLLKWYDLNDLSQKEKTKVIKEVSQLVISTKPKTCSVIEYKDFKVIHRQYASLYFVIGADLMDNELLALEVIHRYVETLDEWFFNVCELDIVYNFTHAYMALDELILSGEILETSKKRIKETLRYMEEVGMCNI